MSEILFEQRVKNVYDARKINDAASGRELTGEERGQIDRLFGEVDKIEMRMNPRPKFEMPDDDDDKPRHGRRGTDEYRATFDSFLRGGSVDLSESERRALVADNGPLGGLAIAPQQMAEAVIKFIDDNLPIRQLATKYQLVAAHSLGIPSIDTDIDDSEWMTELTSGSDDAGLKFGKRELHPHPLIKRIRVSNKVLRRAKNAEALSARN